MATNVLASYDSSDEGYIDIIFSSSPSYILCCSSSPRVSTNDIEFEFHTPFVPIPEESSLIPADNLFHKGKLLPLYLRQTGQETLHGPPEPKKHVVEDDNNLYSSINFVTCTNDQTLNHVAQPSPDDDESFFEWSAHELNSFVGKKPSSKNIKSWIDKVKIVLGQGMRTSIRAYLKSLFVCFEQSCVKEQALSVRSLAFLMNEVEKEGIEGCTRCFPSVTKRCSSTSSSSSSALSSFSFDDKTRYFRSSSDEDDEQDEMDDSVDAAVAYCKKSEDFNFNFGQRF